MAVGRAQHTQASGSAPALSQKLLAWVEAEPALAFFGRLPLVAAGPDALQRQAGSQLLPQQQGAALFGCCSQKRALENDQAMPIEP